MENKTAVEWLMGEIKGGKLITNQKFEELLQQAKEMEKEQMRLIYEGLLQNVGTCIKQSDLPTFEQYYNETFKK
jgi:hypothetical protein